MQQVSRIFLSALLCFCVLTGSFILPAHAQPGVSAEAAILIDADSGRVIWSKNADDRHAMASTTKIMTALVALREMPLDTTVEINPAAVGVEGSSVYLYAGEQLTLEDLLYAMLLESANDAAAAIAIAVSGSIDAFAAEMNACAAELGLENTHFTNPHGLWNEEHYTTARELAQITMQALRYPTFRTMVSTYKKTIPLNGDEGVRLLLNHNKLLKLYDGVIGVKTGYTKKSGRCLVSAAERDGVTLIAVTLNAPNDWQDHTALMELGFQNYCVKQIITKGDVLGMVEIAGGVSGSASLIADADFSYSLTDQEWPEIILQGPGFVYAPIAHGQVAGTAYICLGDKTIGEVPLVFGQTVEQNDMPKPSIWEKLFGGNK